MKKPTFYFINYKGEKTRARSSNHPYTHALIQKTSKGEEIAVMCSSKKEGCEKELSQLKRWNPELDLTAFRIAEIFKEE